VRAGLPKAAGRAAPKVEQENADEDERKTESDPETERSPVAAETEPCAEGKTEQPIRGEMTQHGSARISRAAKSARGNSLDSIEELEGGARGEEGDGAADDGFVGSVEAGDETRKDEKDYAHGRHEGGAEDDGGVASVASIDGRAPADGLTNTNGGGGGEAKGHHVSQGDSVEGDLVTGLGNGAEARDESSDRGKDGDFCGELNCGREAESDELTDASEVGLNGRLEQVGLMPEIVPDEIDDEDKSEVRTRNAGGNAGTGDAVGGESPLAVDQEVVAEKVDEIRSDESEGNGADHVHALKRAPDGEEETQREHAEGQSAHVGGGEGSDGVSDADGLEVTREDPDRDGEERGDRETEIDPVDEGTVAVFTPASAESLRDEGIEADEDAFGEESEDDEEARRNADGADGFSGVRKAADHHGVDNGHGHPADLGEDEGKGEAEGGAEFATEAQEEGHGMR